MLRTHGFVPSTLGYTDRGIDMRGDCRMRRWRRDCFEHLPERRFSGAEFRHVGCHRVGGDYRRQTAVDRRDRVGRGSPGRREILIQRYAGDGCVKRVVDRDFGRVRFHRQRHPAGDNHQPGAACGDRPVRLRHEADRRAHHRLEQHQEFDDHVSHQMAGRKCGAV